MHASLPNGSPPGRPPKSPRKWARSVRLLLDEEDDQILVALASSEKLAYNDVLRRALRQYSRDLKKQLDRDDAAA